MGVIHSLDVKATTRIVEAQKMSNLMYRSVHSSIHVFYDQEKLSLKAGLFIPTNSVTTKFQNVVSNKIQITVSLICLC